MLPAALPPPSTMLAHRQKWGWSLLLFSVVAFLVLWNRTLPRKTYLSTSCATRMRQWAIALVKTLSLVVKESLAQGITWVGSSWVLTTPLLEVRTMFWFLFLVSARSFPRCGVSLLPLLYRIWPLASPVGMEGILVG